MSATEIEFDFIKDGKCLWTIRKGENLDSDHYDIWCGPKLIYDKNEVITWDICPYCKKRILIVDELNKKDGSK